MHGDFLTEVALILALSLAALWVCHRIRVPAIIGYLLTGAFAGPFGLGFVESAEQVDLLAEVGVVLLLFTIGLEFPLATLLRRKRPLLLGGGGQVAVTALAATGVALLLGQPAGISVLVGFVVALSSTAVVLSSLQRAGSLDEPAGRTSLSILIFQDLAIVPMMALLPLLAAADGGGRAGVLGSLVRAGLLLAVVLLAARRAVPWLLERVVSTRSHELFLLAVVTICLAVAWAASLAGLSLALGAFLAGLLVSESEYSHQALGVVIPLRDVFTAFFFVSIGMLFDPDLVVAAPVSLGLGLVGVLAGKGLIAAGTAVLVGLPVASAVVVGLSLAQIGEFSFVLARAGLQADILAQDQYQWLLTVAVMSMAVTPVLIAAGPRVARALEARWPSIAGGPEGAEEVPLTGDGVSGHVVIVGWGVTGRLVTRACAIAGIPYRVIELNPEAVREGREEGEPMIWGDGARDPVLLRAGVDVCRAVVVAIPDASATRQVTAAAHRLNPAALVVVRTGLVEEIEELARLGASEVIPKEWEAAVRIVERLLDSLLVPRHEIESFLSSLRSSGYEALRAPGGMAAAVLEGRLGGAEITTLQVRPRSMLADRTLEETALRRIHGVSVLTIRRGEGFVSNPHGGTRLQAGDQVVVMGLPEEIAAVGRLFRDATDAPREVPTE